MRYAFGELLERFWRLGITRVVLRQLYLPHAPKWTRPGPLPSQLVHCGSYRNNPVYLWKGKAVTDWCFEDSQSTSLNLFPDTCSTNYPMVCRLQVNAVILDPHDRKRTLLRQIALA